MRLPVYLTPEHNDRRALLRQEIILEPMEHPTLFFLGTPREARGRFTAMLEDPLGNLRTITPPGTRIRYEVVSSLVARTEVPTAESRALPPVEPRVISLAREIAGAAKDDAKRAILLLQFFRDDFQYSLTPGDPGDADPLSRFLFDTRTGHCEYFASSLAVMLRAVGIPSLVVNGYLDGEWNPYGEYLVIRQSDAHSWVEAWIDGEWQILDPTPATAAVPGPGFSEWQAMLDAYRMRWYRYVINYTFRDQMNIAFSIRGSARWAWNGLSGDFWRRGWEAFRSDKGHGSPGPARWAAPIGIAAIALAWFWWRHRLRGASGSHWATRRYLVLLALLERRGHRKKPGETADEFLDRIASRLKGDRAAVTRLTRLYQQLRFSGRPTGSQERSEIAALLENLAARR